MNFLVERTSEKGVPLIRISDRGSATSIDILPDHGALLHRFSVEAAGGPFNIIDNYPDPSLVDKEIGTSYKSAKLSPFVCRIPEGKYDWMDNSYELTNKFMDGSAIHGLLYNKPFRIIDEFADDQRAAVRLRYHYKREDAGYPFDYSCELAYTLYPDRALQIESTILNLEDFPIPVADGWHPYFTLGGKVDDYELQFASDAMLEFDEKLIPTGKMIYDPSFKEFNRIGNRQFDNCFLLEPEEGLPVCVLRNPVNHLTLSFFTNENYPYLQIYTPDHRNSIAIENLSGAPDCFNNGMGLIALQPRHSETFTIWYKVHLGENS